MLILLSECSSLIIVNEATKDSRSYLDKSHKNSELRNTNHTLNQNPQPKARKRVIDKPTSSNTLTVT